MAVTQLGSVEVGTIVKLNVNGVPTDFIVVNQGKPSDEYDDSCNGTWILPKDCTEIRQAHSAISRDYTEFDIRSYLNGEYLDQFDEHIRTFIREATIPGVDSKDKAFFLSDYEIGNPDGFTWPYGVFRGSKLSFFEGDSTRIANYDGVPTKYWTRVGFYNPSWGPSKFIQFYIINTDGRMTNAVSTDIEGVRAAMILNPEVCVFEDGTVSASWPPTAPGNIEVTGVVSGETATITLTAATDPDGTVESYIYERLVDGGTSWQQIANVNSLTQTDTISAEWGTVQYRACAVDNNGVSGPYIVSEIQEVNAGYVIISGPSNNLGEKIAPFDFSFSVSITGTATTNEIKTNVVFNGKNIYSNFVNSNDTITIPIDTRILSSGEYNIIISAKKENFISAINIYTFTIPSIVIPSEKSRAELFKSANSNLIFYLTLAKNIISLNGQDLNTILTTSAQIESSTYIGSGASGEDNCNNLTFTFYPDIVLIGLSQNIQANNYNSLFLWFNKNSKDIFSDNVVTFKNNTLSWYNETPEKQLNSLNKNYGYIAIKFKEI